MGRQISGVVEQVGEKFNGSVKVDGKYYNFKKGATPEGLAHLSGKLVTLNLEPWSFKGKTGENVTGVTVKDGAVSGPVSTVTTVTTPATAATPYKSRDFDAEARGKTRCQLVAASMALVLTDVVTLERLQKTVDALVDYVFDGKIQS